MDVYVCGRELEERIAPECECCCRGKMVPEDQQVRFCAACLERGCPDDLCTTECPLKAKARP